MKAYYNSRDLKYKKPFGAMKTESSAEFFIETEGVFSATLRLWSDNRETLVPMEKKEGGFSCWAVMPEKAQLVWYHFILETDEGWKIYSDNEERFGGEGVLKAFPDGKDYQITVYDKNFKTPKWFSGSVMYQIFPDRFYKGEDLPKKREEYILHKDWNEPFAFQKHPFENGPACNDFYGGNLKGIEEKLPYLADLGISVIYLNPIFDAYSNHKYDTADYTKIDPMFGTEEDFKRLCEKAKKKGIRIILDGVFSHTGSDSVYFNKYKNYGEGVGAYQDENSPYRKWYQFKDGNNYESWWGCTNLPNVNETEPTYLDHILTGEDAIIKKWLSLGASGWRLDVADELPDSFIKTLRSEAKSEKEDCVIIGEVWEDASNKISYSSLREYLLGDELDSVMNYPFKDSMIDLIKGYINASQFEKRIMKILENYPKEVSYSLMNMAGTHDTPRIKTVLGTNVDPGFMSDEEKWNYSLSGDEEKLALERLMLMVFMQMTFVGVPSIYYGDEAGMEGFRDPYNRKPFPWGNINEDLLNYHKKLIKLRNEHDFLKRGTFQPLYAKDKVFVYLREIKDGKDVFGNKAKNGAGLFIVNCSDETVYIKTEVLGERAKELTGEEEITILPRKTRFFIGK
ncbi:MAG: glycoside hydrolase family 13 protein [Clostridia bacterium]|nr:glycoside hydrolase family 13 protein [Clostridia bacterium]